MNIFTAAFVAVVIALAFIAGRITAPQPATPSTQLPKGIFYIEMLGNEGSTLTHEWKPLVGVNNAEGFTLSEPIKIEKDSYLRGAVRAIRH